MVKNVETKYPRCGVTMDPAKFRTLVLCHGNNWGTRGIVYKRFAIVVVVALSLIVGSACGSQQAASERDAVAGSAKPAPITSTAAQAKPTAAPAAPAAAKPAEPPVPPKPAAPVPAAAAAAMPAKPAVETQAQLPPSGSGGASASQPAIAAPLPVIPNDSRMVIYDGTVNLEVISMADTINQLTVVASDEGGYIATSDVQPAQGRGTVILKVRGDRFASAMARIRAFGTKVINEKVSSQDVSEEFADVETQLRSLRASHATYLDLLKRSTTIEDILKVQAKIAELEQQINRLEGRRTFLSRRTELATITVQLTLPPGTPTPTATVTPTSTPTTTPTTTATQTPTPTVVWNPGTTARSS